jgi:hypothetical protein
MKQIIALITLVVSVCSFAQDTVVLNSQEVSVNAAEAVVVRTNQTPNNVDISFLIPMANSVCQRYDTREVLRASRIHCGVVTRTRTVRTGRVCVRTNPHNGECLRYEDTSREETTTHARTCLVPESYCAQYGTSTSFKRDTMKIRFKGLPSLGDSESETFMISARQKNYDGIDVVYDVTPLETVREYKVTQKKFLGLFAKDSYVVEER